MSRTCLDDVFALPLLDGALVYFPRRGVVMGVSPEVSALIEELKAGRVPTADPLADAWMPALQALAGSEPQVCADVAGPFRPTHVTLSLTSRCNLRCVYCYARAGETERDLDPRAARAALTLVADNARDAGEAVFRVAFHGEGEPTRAWPLFQSCVLHAEALAAERGMGVDFSMTTNAMWGPVQRRFVIEHFRYLSVSLDGLPDVQDVQRPTTNDKGSFAAIARNLRALDAAGIGYGVRATVLPTGLGGMLQFLDFLCDHTKATTLTLEPVFQSGRGISLPIDRASFYRDFMATYREVQHRAAGRGIDISYSGCKPTVAAGRFCQATGPELNFVIMSNGVVSSCYEINDPAGDKGRLLVYGRFDPATDSFEIDDEKVRRLRNMGVWSMPGCNDCFARWNCGGDCLARCDVSIEQLGHGLDRSGTPRCRLNRDLTTEALARHAIADDVLDLTQGGEYGHEQH